MINLDTICSFYVFYFLCSIGVVVEGEFARGLMLLSGYALPASRRCACGFMLHLEGYRHACLVTDDLDTVGVGLAG